MDAATEDRGSGRHPDRVGGSRIAFLPATLTDNLPVQTCLITGTVKEYHPLGGEDEFPFLVEGVGQVDCHSIRSTRMILHIVNLSSPGAWRQPSMKLLPIWSFYR